MTSRKAPGLRVAVVGATGMVGKVLIETLESRRFPVGELLPFSSGRRPSFIRFRGRSLAAPGLRRDSLDRADLVFMVSSDAVSLAHGRRLCARGIWVIDDSSAFRLAPDVPLVIPEVNADALRPDRRLIAGPNCTVTGAAVAGFPLYRAAGARAVRIASYQAVSGAGREALREFYSQLGPAARVLAKGELLPKLPVPRAAALPQPIAFNVFPQVGRFDENGDSGEELKVRAELRKLWNAPSLRVSATAARVPVIRGHSLAVWLETRRPLSPAAARALLRRAPGVRLYQGPVYPTARGAADTHLVHAGRVRRSGACANELAFWVVSDNLLKGAALNSIQIAEFLLRKRWLKAS